MISMRNAVLNSVPVPKHRNGENKLLQEHQSEPWQPYVSLESRLTVA